MNFFLSIAIFLILLTACTSSAKKDMMPEVKTADSAVVMFYHEPGNPRFFNIAKCYRTDSLAVVVNDVNSRIISVADSCKTEGKIYFYGKGDAVFPVYFTRNRGCLFFSFIKTGVKYHTRMNDASAGLLNEMEKKALRLPGSSH